MSAWLAFEFRCGRGYLFSEHYLAHALGQLLRYKDMYASAEYPHPTITRGNGSGRPPAVDFVIQGPNSKPHVGVEVKWASTPAVTSNALLWDAFRIEAFCRKTEATGFLILAGETSKVEAVFSNKSFRTAGGRSLLTREPIQGLPSSAQNAYLLKRMDLRRQALDYLNKKMERYPGSDKIIAEGLYCSVPTGHTFTIPKAVCFSVYVWEIRPASTIIVRRKKSPAASTLINSVNPIHSSTDPFDELVLKTLRKLGQPSKLGEIFSIAGSSKYHLRKSLERLGERGLVDATGNTRARVYRVRELPDPGNPT